MHRGTSLTVAAYRTAIEFVLARVDLTSERFAGGIHDEPVLFDVLDTRDVFDIPVSVLDTVPSVVVLFTPDSELQRAVSATKDVFDLAEDGLL
jgi:hypothetical protein